MMTTNMKKYALLSLIIILSLTSFAQNFQDAQNELNILIQKRSELFQEWKRNKDENNAFFGGKSKKDLQRIIQTQQTIINIDNEIMSAIQNVENQRTTTITAKKDFLSDRTLQFDQEQKRMQNLIAQRDNKIKSQTEQIDDLERNIKYLSIALFLGIASLIGIGYFRFAKNSL
jgi:hypothetical protein